MTLSHDDDIRFLRRSVALGLEARAAGNHPFGALLVDAEGHVLIEAGNDFSHQKGPGHAETIVAREAAMLYEPEFLENCTLYTAFEPCAMCAGSTYWANIGALVYGMTEKRLAQITGTNEENLTMDLPCRTVFEAGQRKTVVRGPFPELETEIAKSHEGFW
ncbi:MAG: nucleoside deaminase [Hyphomicrobiaceae bacterium]|nr:nucleoside deaminase [Hyphomicrobiaceae bacterium]MCC0023853.1 nucleoside deaminase [Hyphomicrobiaceae bacterium]